MDNSLFTGFPDKTEVIPIPTVMITSVMKEIAAVNELKVILHLFRLLAKKRGYLKILTFSELSSDTVLLDTLDGGDIENKIRTLRQALIQASKHGIILNIRLKGTDREEDVYLLNNESGKRNLKKIDNGELVISNLLPVMQLEMRTQLPTIFSLYEQNIGLLTPIIAEDLQEAEKTYPIEWIESAFKEAVTLNKRNWRYISRILERWAIEGKDDGKSGEYNKKKKSDPDRYIHGKYGHMVQR